MACRNGSAAMNKMQITFFIMTAILAAEDLRCRKVPRCAFAVYGISVLAYRFAAGLDFLQYMLQGLWGVLLFVAVRMASRKKLGLGDAWYAGCAGLTVPFVIWNAGLAAGSLAALGYAKAAGKKKIAFIPFMGAGLFAVQSVCRIRGNM